MAYIVGANSDYSPVRWQIRQEDENLDDAHKVSVVIATGVRFTRLPSPDWGFGCGIGAICESVETPEHVTVEPGGVELEFVIDRFVIKNTGDDVTMCRQLILGNHGSVTAYF